MPGGLEKLHGLSPLLACCLSSSLLVSLFLTLSSFHPLLLYLLLFAFSVYQPPFPLQCPFLSSLSTSISQCHSCAVAFLTSLPCDSLTFLFPTSASIYVFFSRATASPLLFVSVSLSPSCWHSPCGSCRISMTEPGPHGSYWPASSQ